MLGCKDKSFLDFLMKCFEWDPETRITPKDALLHEWIIEGLPPKVLQQHRKMLGVSESRGSKGPRIDNWMSGNDSTEREI